MVYTYLVDQPKKHTYFCAVLHPPSMYSVQVNPFTTTLVPSLLSPRVNLPVNLLRSVSSPITPAPSPNLSQTPPHPPSPNPLPSTNTSSGPPNRLGPSSLLRTPSVPPSYRVRWRPYSFSRRGTRVGSHRQKVVVTPHHLPHRNHLDLFPDRLDSETLVPPPLLPLTLSLPSIRFRLPPPCHPPRPSTEPLPRRTWTTTSHNLLFPGSSVLASDLSVTGYGVYWDSHPSDRHLNWSFSYPSGSRTSSPRVPQRFQRDGGGCGAGSTNHCHRCFPSK